MELTDLPQVAHRPELGRFEIEVDGALCVLEYQRVDGQFVVLHTGVPERLRGRGLAERLTRVALDHARAQSWRVVPQCSYTRRYLQRHPEAAAPP